MTFITEDNIQNQAYQLLMEVFIEQPNQEQLELLGSLFEEWCKSARPNLLHHMFEIIEAHESVEIRRLVIQQMQNHYPKKKRSDILDLWITHPIPIMREFIRELLNSHGIPKGLQSAAYIMLDEINETIKIDPDYHYLDNYIRTIDPLLGSLLIQRVEKIKNPELDSSSTLPGEDEQISLIDRIRRRDFNYLWEQILDYPLPFICELIKILDEEGWEPSDTSGKIYFETLVEQLGVSGWYANEDLKWIAVTKKSGKKYFPLTPVEIERRSFTLQISQDIVTRPDRVQQEKFQSRGRFNLTDPDLGLNMYLESVRKSDFDGMLHIPIYSNNGVELAEFSIPAVSENNFVMDEDGMYFTVQNKEGIFTVDLDALAALLVPVSRHSESISETIPVLVDRANQLQKLATNGLALLSTLHQGRDFSLWDLKMENSVERPISSKSPDCQCIIAFDIGNSTTKAVTIPKGSCEHESQTWEVPTLIYYKSPSEFIIGEAVVAKDLYSSSQTFRNLKKSLKHGNKPGLRIQSSIITNYQAYGDFLARLLDKIQSDVSFDISNLVLTYPLQAPSGFESWIRSFLSKFQLSSFEVVDEMTASIIGSFRLENQRGLTMFVDVGESHMSCGLADLPLPKSRKKLEVARMREDLGITPHIITKYSVFGGSAEITDLFYQNLKTDVPEEELYLELEETKQNLAHDFSATYTHESKDVIFSLNEGDDSINIAKQFDSSIVLNRFKILLRNTMIIARSRGIPKDKIENIVVLGKGSSWPAFLEYIYRVFKGKEIILESDHHLAAKGAGLVVAGQDFDQVLNQDYMLKVAKQGITSYIDILSRGDTPLGSSKEYEIRPNSYIDQIVLDCWVRRPNVYFEEDIDPAKDSDFPNHLKASRHNFVYERIFRDILPFTENSKLVVKVLPTGNLMFILQNKKDKLEINSLTSVM